jgi:hypothetical protein
VLPLQHPFGHEAPSQTHCPVVVLHSWPVAHALHAAPPAPHEAPVSLVSASHPEPLQHPAHELPPQLHTPLEHACPPLHGLQTAPAVPHWALDCEVYGVHTRPLQQPFGHEAASQTHCPVVLLHSVPAPQAPHVAPPTPHEGVDSAA